MAIRCVGVDNDGIWGGNLGVKGKRGSGEGSGEIFEVGVKDGMGHAGLYGEEGTAKGKIEGQGG